MKVLDLAEFFSERGGGVRAYLTQLLREGTKRGHELTVIAPGPRDETVSLEGGTLHRVRGPALPYDPTYHALYRLDRVRALIEATRPDVLQASSPYVAGWYARSVKHIPLKVLVVHSDFVDTYARAVLQPRLGRAWADRALAAPWSLVRRLASGFDRTVVAGEWLADKLRGHEIPRVVCVPFGIESGRFSPSNHDPAVRARFLGALAGNPDARLVAVVGRIAVEKRVGFVFDALAAVSRERPVAVMVLGDGPERARVEARAKRLGLCATFTGFITDREAYARTLASADALVHGCPHETFGFSVAEALASGVPVVVPDAGGASDFVNPDCGERYDAWGSPMDAAVATRRLLDRPLAPLRVAAAAAGRRVRDSGAHFDELFAMYAAALAAKGAS